MTYFNAKLPNDRGEYEITFGSTEQEKVKAVEMFCRAILDEKFEDPLGFVEFMVGGR